MSARSWAVASIALVTSASLGFACSSVDDAIGATGDAGIPDATLADGAWGTTSCASCTLHACNLELVDCRADPGCALNLDCVEACPARPDGDPDPACVARCPAAAASASETPRRALERCRLAGRATACEACPASQLRRYRNPLLTNACPSPAWDAGAGATPVQETCAKCIAERCCTSRDACRQDPTCFDLKDCYGACTDSACEAACFAQYDSSIGTLFGFVGCAVVHCNVDCGSGTNACSTCINDRCADPNIACQADHDCFLLTRCVTPCKEFSCIEACNATYPAGTAKLEELEFCAQRSCTGCRG